MCMHLKLAVEELTQAILLGSRLQGGARLSRRPARGWAGDPLSMRWGCLRGLEQQQQAREPPAGCPHACAVCYVQAGCHYGLLLHCSQPCCI